MPKIDISFSELLTITTVLELWADEVQVVDQDAANQVFSLQRKLHERFAAEATEDDYREAEA